jgi:Ca-activated chloride channel homolog
MGWLPTFSAWGAGLLGLALVTPTLLLLYFLKLRRKEHTVSSTFLWKKAVQDLQVNAPFQKLRRNLLLLLQALILGALLLALARPESLTSAPPALNTVILIDRSGSMNTKDTEAGTRLDEAKSRALKLIDQMSTGTRCAVIAFDSRAQVMQTATADKTLLRRAVEGRSSHRVQVRLQARGDRAAARRRSAQRRPARARCLRLLRRPRRRRR